MKHFYTKAFKKKGGVHRKSLHILSSWQRKTWARQGTTQLSTGYVRYSYDSSLLYWPFNFHTYGLIVVMKEHFCFFLEKSPAQRSAAPMAHPLHPVCHNPDENPVLSSIALSGDSHKLTHTVEKNVRHLHCPHRSRRGRSQGGRPPQHRCSRLRLQRLRQGFPPPWVSVI